MFLSDFASVYQKTEKDTPWQTLMQRQRWQGGGTP